MQQAKFDNFSFAICILLLKETFSIEVSNVFLSSFTLFSKMDCCKREKSVNICIKYSFFLAYSSQILALLLFPVNPIIAFNFAIDILLRIIFRVIFIQLPLKSSMYFISYCSTDNISYKISNHCSACSINVSYLLRVYGSLCQLNPSECHSFNTICVSFAVVLSLSL